MKFLDSVKNSELVINCIENDRETLVIALRGKISSSFTGSILTKDLKSFNEHVYNRSPSWDRVVIDFRGLTYVNSIGAGMIISLYRNFKESLSKIVLLFKRGSMVSETLSAIGFFKIYQPQVVWDKYDQAIVS
ncbi:MAG: hypothetical protein B6244_04570 [Candidatus Cloacimonetes bacterium 4572_55]|nr:MAG: hypothetical protein B6244_04570 [Candidatus Cloacimonetes bacterium 4572_55]